MREDRDTLNRRVECSGRDDVLDELCAAKIVSPAFTVYPLILDSRPTPCEPCTRRACRPTPRPCQPSGQFLGLCSRWDNQPASRDGWATFLAHLNPFSRKASATDEPTKPVAGEVLQRTGHSKERKNAHLQSPERDRWTMAWLRLWSRSEDVWEESKPNETEVMWGQTCITPEFVRGDVTIRLTGHTVACEGLLARSRPTLRKRRRPGLAERGVLDLALV